MHYDDSGEGRQVWPLHAAADSRDSIGTRQRQDATAEHTIELGTPAVAQRQADSTETVPKRVVAFAQRDGRAQLAGWRRERA